MSLLREKLLLILLGAVLWVSIDVVFGQTVEQCTLQNVVIDPGPGMGLLLPIIYTTNHGIVNIYRVMHVCIEAWCIWSIRRQHGILAS